MLKTVSVTRLYIMVLFFFGLVYLAILPVFEGFDETAHFASLRQIADTGTIPVYGKSFLPQDVTLYKGPVPYSSLEPPYDKGMVYQRFFNTPGAMAAYLKAYRQEKAADSFVPSDTPNWQAQHPFLYYLVLAPLVKATEVFPLVTQFLLLRLASYLLALGGVLLGVLAFRNKTLVFYKDPAMLGFLLYPVLLPMFFAEFARLGNDSLCLFFTGLIAYLFAGALKNISDKKRLVALGVALGLGLLTKAFFIPVTLALCGFSIVQQVGVKKPQQSVFSCLRPAAIIAAPAVLIGGGWYVYKALVYGDIIGSNDAIQLTQQGGLFQNLLSHFSLYGLARGVVATFVSWSWAGTWSLARLPAWVHLPVLLLTVWVVISFGLEVKKRPLGDTAWLPIWLFGIFGCGLFYHIILSLAINGNGNTPGWYLHILMPWAAPALGLGLLRLFNHPRSKGLLTGLLIYAACFQGIALWSQFALFTGGAVKDVNKLYAFSGHWLCLDQTPLLLQRLNSIGWPLLAVFGLIGSMVCALFLLKTAWYYSVCFLKEAGKN